MSAYPEKQGIFTDSDELAEDGRNKSSKWAE
jgi:hypothetical protein